MDGMTAQRRTALLVSVLYTTAFLAVFLLTGCGGGNTGTGMIGNAPTPTSTTRVRVQQMLGQSQRSLIQIGYQNIGMLAPLNGAPLVYSKSGKGDIVPTENSHSVPMIAAFLKNIAAMPRQTRAAHIITIHQSLKNEPGALENGSVSVAPTFYYDYYLGLWVDIQDAPGNTTYSLYEDQAKTKVAGSIVTVLPTDSSASPQVYSSTYTFTAGYLAGENGTSTNTIRADYSCNSSYKNTYADGTKDTGRSSWTSQGGFSWSARTQSGDSKQRSVARGAFYPNGSGGTHLETSEGYTADYVYNSNGSGRGTITGPDPGLPLTVAWDTFGNTTIRYADGTEESYNSWSGSRQDSNGLILAG